MQQNLIQNLMKIKQKMEHEHHKAVKKSPDADPAGTLL